MIANNNYKDNRANVLFSKAINLHHNLNFNKAKEFYLKVLHIIPNHPDTLHMLGVIDFQKSEFQSSIKYIRSANILKPNDPNILFNLGNALRSAGNLKEATIAYLDSLNINPFNLEALANLGNIYKAISGSVSSLFTLKSQETVSSRYFFTRVKNSDFNYTTNPSSINESGSLLYNTLIDNPQTYITTVGMYNDNNDLLAVAKLSRPLVKDFTKEALIRIKLDY